jgi:histidyl-tRNA synthetase
MEESPQEFVLKPPKGMVDFPPKEMEKRDWVMRTIESVMIKNRVPKLDTPVMERREILYAKAGEETGSQIYDLVERGEVNEQSEKLSLRFDLTVPLARYLAQNGITKFKRYQTGKGFVIFGFTICFSVSW